MPNKGQFQKGPDPRRHIFTAEECSKGGQHPNAHRLTQEHRVAGGLACWQRYMIRHRKKQGLPIPENLAQQYPEILAEEQDVLY